MTLRELARVLGGEINGHQVLAPGPGHSSKDRSLWVRASADAPDGLLCGSFAGQDWQTCKDYVRARLGLPVFGGEKRTPTHEIVRQPVAADPSEARKREAALRIWEEAKDPRGSIVSTYLESRGLSLPTEIAGPVVRFHPACPWREGEVTIRVPAMVAALRSIETNELVGIQRTRLTEGGQKVDRRMLGTAGGAAIKITHDADVTTCLGIGEGLETILSMRLIPEFGHSPIWAVASAGALAGFPVLPGVECLWLAVDNDNAGRRAVEECSARWELAGRETFLILPRNAKADLNDIARSAA